MYRTTQNLPLEHQYDMALEVFGSVTTLELLREPFHASHYGAALRTLPPRYELFYWDDLEKFAEYMGADMDPVQHGVYQARTVAIPLLEQQAQADMLPQMTDQQSHHFIAYHAVHDDHEGITGDKALPFKTAEDDLDEQIIWTQMINDVYGEEESEQFRTDVGTFVAKGDDFEPLLWDISERIGYIATGLQGWRLREEETDLTQEERDKCFLLARDVCSRSLARVANSRDVVAYADDFMMRFSDVFRQIAVNIDVTYDAFVMEGAGIVNFKK